MTSLSAAAQMTFSQLYFEFVQSYATSRAAHQYAELIPHLREDAARNYRQITEAAAQGEDVTEAVLSGLLPHAGSEKNRARGAWIYLTPAIHGEVTQWHQRLGWAQPEDWPQKAAAILDFVRTAVEEPDRLAEACVAFSALPYTTGFQSGMLSPILNALRPNLYLTINAKSLRTINYFCDASHSLGILDYPAANRAGMELVHLVREEDGSPQMPPLRAVDRFDLFCYWLVTVRQFDFSKPRYWQIRTGADGQWDLWRAGGFIAVGYDELGDLSDLRRSDFNRLRDRLVPQNKAWTRRDVDQVWRFAHHMHEGDPVVVHNGAGEILGLGVVGGFYYYVPDVAMGHCRPVIWDDLNRRQWEGAQWRTFLSEIDAATFAEVVRAPVQEERRLPPIRGSHAIPTLPAEEQAEIATPKPVDAAVAMLQEPPSPYQILEGDHLPPYPLDQCAEESGFEEAQLAEWVAAIERKGQAIFYGPPGTGKSFVASALARHLVGGEDGFVEQLQFHPAYAYEDFVQGIRPVVEEDGAFSYRLTPGRFVTFCRAAAGRNGRCVLVIDEINRADPARVFGEVMQLLEYRGQTLALAAGGQLKIPPNVRIVATMNTADRSIALVDAALRRRFAFLALYPDYDVLRRYHQRQGTGFNVDGLVGVLQRLNRQIGDSHYAVGITYFLHPDLHKTIQAIWRTEIEPYLEEYFYNQPEQVAAFRWSRVCGEILNGS
jgi:MoxR-like ATPase